MMATMKIEEHYRRSIYSIVNVSDFIVFDMLLCNDDVLCLSGYPAMGKYLNATGRPILYSCEWALYARAKGYKVNNLVFVSFAHNDLQEKIFV